MKIAFYLILLVFLPLLFLSFPVKAGSESLPAGESPQLVVLFMLDGFRPDYLAMYDLPVIESLVKTGVYYAEAKGVFPSTTSIMKAIQIAMDINMDHIVNKRNKS